MSISATSRWMCLGVFLLLIGCSGDPTDKLINQLRDPQVETRRAAVRAIGQQPRCDDREIAALTVAVADRDADVRRGSILALGKSGAAAKASISALGTALKDSETPVRVSAALAIQKIDPKNSSFRPVLMEAMHAGDGRVLLEVGAMGKDAAWAVPTLKELLSHESANMRALAAQTLGRIGPAAGDAKAALQQKTRDSNPAVQNASRVALERIQGVTH